MRDYEEVEWTVRLDEKTKTVETDANVSSSEIDGSEEADILNRMSAVPGVLLIEFVVTGEECCVPVSGVK